MTKTMDESKISNTTEALIIAKSIELNNGLTLLVAPSAKAVNVLFSKLSFFLKNKDIPLIRFPDRETLPYDIFSPHHDLVSERLETLQQLHTLDRGALILSVTTLMSRLSPTNFISSRSFKYAIGEKLNLTKLKDQLSENGYRRVETVYEHGEYALRGSIIDVFPMGVDKPFRIDLFDEEIETIRIFSPDTQLSNSNIPSIDLLPANEFPMDQNAVNLFSKNWISAFDSDPLRCPIYISIRKGIIPNGIEAYLPLFFEKTSNLFDYLPSNISVLITEDIHKISTQYWNEINSRYETFGSDITRPILRPEQLFISPTEILTSIKAIKPLDCGKARTEYLDKTLPGFEEKENIDKTLAAIETFISNEQTKVPDTKFLFCVESPGRREVLMNMLQKINIYPREISSWSEFVISEDQYSIVVSDISDGMNLFSKKQIIFSESDIFGEQVHQRRLRENNDTFKHNFFRDLSELKLDEPVVHLEYGIGLYKGLQTLSINNIESEFITLMYAEESKIYLPVSSINLISRYSSGSNIIPKLNRLGSDSWGKAKEKAEARARDTAVELLDVYARRAKSVGFSYLAYEDEYQKFSNEFNFEETPDQRQAIASVRKDLLEKNLMDRLICGDVGFGKTEVSMRAAFSAMINAKQVVVLVPTTLLAQQHLSTFRDRFSNWPFKIEELSRFKTQREQKEIIADLEKGRIDLLISTHKLLYQNINFKNLSLMIIDEEHRFGVRQKEKLKSLKSNIDILTMTATPIPRTLNLAINEVRDLSIIATPPERRLSVKTFITTYKTAILEEAISREILRGGQVYFLHNDVKTIARVTEELSNLLPEISFNFAHGQMKERDLERVMSDFYHQNFSVLVCTTIIETGIDIPSANTIIIDNADKFGLAQLHQLRGRVGRSHHQAYAYLLVNEHKKLSKDANKRLEAISMSEKLGSGFILATNDLEIRGAGELLGDEQSGHIQTIGFSLYMDILDQAIKEQKSGNLNLSKTLMPEEVEINLDVAAFIPESYIADINTRLTTYKRIADCKNAEDIYDLQVEMIDRFGLLPIETKSLFRISELKSSIKTLGIIKLEFSKSKGRIKFSETTKVDPQKIINLIQKKPEVFQLKSQNQLNFNTNSIERNDVFDKISDILSEII